MIWLIDWLINTLYCLKWHILHRFIYCLYVSYCSVTNIWRTILHVVLRKILYLLFFHPKKKELRMSYYNTRFAIASNSGRWHPVLHIVTVASTIMSVQKSNGISIIHVGISMSKQPPPLFFFSSVVEYVSVLYIVWESFLNLKLDTRASRKVVSRDTEVYYRGLSILIFFLEGTLDRQHVYILTERRINCSIYSSIASVSYNTCNLSCTI